MPPRFQTAGPLAPDVSQGYGAAQQYSQDMAQLLGQQQLLARIYEEGTARAQQAAQFGASQEEQRRQFDTTVAQRAREFDLGYGQQERQFGAQLGQRRFEFGAGQQFQADRDRFLAAQQAQRDVFGAAAQERRDVFGAAQQQARDVFGAQRGMAELGAQQQFQMGRDVFGAQQQQARDVFGAEQAARQQQERFQLQAQLQQTELTQAEQLRLQRLQAGIAHVRGDQTLDDPTREQLIRQMMLGPLGVNELQMRQSAAQVRHLEQQDQLLEQQANRQVQLMQRQMDALNPDNFPNRVVRRRDPATGLRQEYWLDVNGNIHPFESPRGAGAGAGTGGGGGGGRQDLTFQQYTSMRTVAEQSLPIGLRFTNARGNAQELTADQIAQRERLIQQDVARQLAGFRANLPAPPPRAEPQNPFPEGDVFAMTDLQHRRVAEFRAYGRAAMLNPQLPQGQREYLVGISGQNEQLLSRFGGVEDMPEPARLTYERNVRELRTRLPHVGQYRGLDYGVLGMGARRGQ